MKILYNISSVFYYICISNTADLIIAAVVENGFEGGVFEIHRWNGSAVSVSDYNTFLCGKSYNGDICFSSLPRKPSFYLCTDEMNGNAEEI